MIGKLKRYPEYRNSDSQWIAQIPAHWSLARLGSVLRERGEVNEQEQVTEVLSVLKGIGVIRYEDKGNIGNKKSDDISRYKIVRPDDVVVNCMNVMIGSVGRSRYTGCLSPVYYVLTRRSERDNPRYLSAVFETKPFYESLVRIGNGILAHRMRVPMELLKCEPFPLPPADEQDAIVRFLEWATGRLDRAIRIKRKLIALLKEQKQAIIHRAVTRGLQPNVTLKQSGSEWLGNIPAHWSILPIKRVLSSITYGISDASSETGRIPVLGMGNIRDGMVTAPQPGGVDHVEASLFLRSNDLLFNRTNSAELVGKVGIFRGSDVPTTFASYLVRLRVGPNSDPEYLNYLLNSQAVLNMARQMAIPSLHQSNLNPNRYSRIRIAIPPLHEQIAIVVWLKEALVGIESAISNVKREVVLLDEYRTCLIADVVTGKFDVRGIEIPTEETAEPAEPLDSAELESEEDELVEEYADAD